MTYLFYAILIYLLYRFITGFVLPVIKTSSQVRQQFRNMHQQAHTGNGRQHAYDHSSKNGVDQKPKFDMEGEYIKFEEVKD